MRRLVIHTGVLGLFLLVMSITGLVVSAHAQGSSFSDDKVLNDETVGSIPATTTASGLTGASSTYSGISPGFDLQHTYRDDQYHLGSSRMVDWNVGPQIHFTWAQQLFAGNDYFVSNRFCLYNMFDPSIPPLGVWLSPVGVIVQPDPLIISGWQPNLDVEEKGHAVLACETFDLSVEMSLSTVYWDLGAPATWGIFVGEELSAAPGEYVKYPRIEYQQFYSDFITHVVALLDFGDPSDDLDAIAYFRKSADSAGPVGSWTSMPVSDRVWSNQYAIAASQTNGQVAICWIEWPGFANGSGPMEGELWVMTSYDGGLSWGSPVLITENLENGYSPWLDISALYDSDEYLHVVYTALQGDKIDPARIYHWTDRIPGPDAGGNTSLILHADGLEHMCGRGGPNVANVAKPVISECDGRLYVVWQQYGNIHDGDTLDCPAETYPNHYGPLYNSEIWMSVSLGLDGLAFDQPRNLTNTKSPDCDGTDYGGGPCENEVFPSVSRYGYNNYYNGAYYWDNADGVYEMADMLAPTYSDEWYLDIMYVVDLMAGPVRYADDQSTALWTRNPVKWNRLPCVEPEIGGRILVEQEDFWYPDDWVQTGYEASIGPVAIHNIGNADLNVVDIRADMITGPTGSISIYPTSMIIPPGGYDQFTVVLNPGGAITTPTKLEAEINIDSDDPFSATYLAFRINTVIADDVAPMVWNTISTSAAKLAEGPALTVATNGNAGNSGIGYVNLDFAGYIDCDESQNVYLNDLTSVVMYDGSGAEGTYFWAPLYDPHSDHDHDFHPQVDGLTPSETTTDEYQMFSTGTFATADSVIGCTKHFLAPLNNDSYILERWDVYSLDGSPHSGVWLGEWIDWDVPSYSDDSNEGGILATFSGVDCIWQRGVVDPFSAVSPCLDEDRRYGASGLLGWYYSSEFDIDPDVNHIGLWAGNVLSLDDLYEGGYSEFDTDSVWQWLSQRPGLGVSNTAYDDKEMLLSYGSFDIYPWDTLRIWTVHTSVYDGDEYDMESKIDDALIWYYENRGLDEGCGCGNVDCDAYGNANLNDIVKLIDHLFITKLPLQDPVAANVDMCNGIDLADLMLLIYSVYIEQGYPMCTGLIDCDYQPAGDSVQLVVSFWPHDHAEYTGINKLQIDMWVRNQNELKGLEMYCNWDNPNVRLVGTTTTSLVDSAFYPDSMFTYMDFGGDNATQTFYFTGFNYWRGLPPDSANKWIWVRYMFEVDAWSAGDSIVVDLQPTHSGATLKAVATQPGGVPVPYTPHFNGPLIIKDGFEQCCGMYVLAPDQTGNTNCGFDGKLTLADISRLIDKIYISKEPLCCSPNGNTNGSVDQKHTLSDISELIDRLYISKLPAADCL